MVRPLTFLSDYGLEDDFVGVCHAVIARIAPEARVVDLTHGLDRHDVRTAAIVLRRALPFCAAGVHLAVVDPGGGGRRGAARAGGPSRCARPRRTACWSGPTTGCCRSPRSASAASPRSSTWPARAIVSS